MNRRTIRRLGVICAVTAVVSAACRSQGGRDTVAMETDSTEVNVTNGRRAVGDGPMAAPREPSPFEQDSGVAAAMIADTVALQTERRRAPDEPMPFPAEPRQR